MHKIRVDRGTAPSEVVSEEGGYVVSLGQVRDPGSSSGCGAVAGVGSEDSVVIGSSVAIWPKGGNDRISDREWELAKSIGWLYGSPPITE
jgi:hypothetical protein